MIIMASMVKKTLIIGMVALLLGTFGALFSQVETPVAQAQQPKSYGLEWVKVLNVNSRSAVVSISLEDPGSSDFVTILTSEPRVYILEIKNGQIVGQSTRIRTSTFPVADQFFAASKSGDFVAWLDLQRSGPWLFVQEVKKGVFSENLDYVANPVPTVLQISQNAKYIVIGDRNGIVALYEQG